MADLIRDTNHNLALGSVGASAHTKKGQSEIEGGLTVCRERMERQGHAVQRDGSDGQTDGRIDRGMKARQSGVGAHGVHRTGFMYHALSTPLKSSPLPRPRHLVALMEDGNERMNGNNR